MEVSENLCQTGLDAVYRFTQNQLVPSQHGIADPVKLNQYSAAYEVFEILSRISGDSKIRFTSNAPSEFSKNGVGSIVDDAHSDVAFFSTDDPDFLKKLSDFFEKVDSFSLYAYEENTGVIRLAVEWRVEDVYT